MHFNYYINEYTYNLFCIGFQEKIENDDWSTFDTSIADLQPINARKNDIDSTEQHLLIASLPILTQSENNTKSKIFVKNCGDEGVIQELYHSKQYVSTFFEEFTNSESNNSMQVDPANAYIVQNNFTSNSDQHHILNSNQPTWNGIQQREISIHQTPDLNEKLSEQWRTSVTVQNIGFDETVQNSEKTVVYPVLESSSVSLESSGENDQVRISHTECPQLHSGLIGEELCIPRNDSEAINLGLDMQMEVPSDNIEAITLHRSENIQLEPNVVQQHARGCQKTGEWRGSRLEKNNSDFEKDHGLKTSKNNNRRRRKLFKLYLSSNLIHQSHQHIVFYSKLYTTF